MEHKSDAGELGREVFCIKFDPNGNYLAAACKDGTIRIYNIHGEKIKEAFVLNTDPGEKAPITSIKWRPLKSAKATKNVLLAVTAKGVVQQWHTSGKMLKCIKDDTNELYCADYNADGSRFATAGKDGKIRIYDELHDIKTVDILLTGTPSRPGHTNRLFCVKFDPVDPFVVASAGWD